MENPNVTAAMYGIDVSYLQVKVNEGALFPTVTLQVSVQQAYEHDSRSSASSSLPRRSRRFRCRSIRAARNTR